MFVGTESGSLPVPDMDPLEQMLMEYPSMSVYHLKCAMNKDDDEEEDEDISGLLF